MAKKRAKRSANTKAPEAKKEIVTASEDTGAAVEEDKDENTDVSVTDSPPADDASTVAVPENGQDEASPDGASDNEPAGEPAPTPPDEPVDGVSTDVPPEDEPAGEPAPTEDGPQLLSLEDAARRFVVGYKIQWLPSIEEFAKTQGFSGKGTEEECRVILKNWGARLQ
jgi:hypothetical protein